MTSSRPGRVTAGAAQGGRGDSGPSRAERSRSARPSRPQPGGSQSPTSQSQPPSPRTSSSRAWRDPIGPNASVRAWRTAAVFSAPPAVVIGLILLLTVSWIAGIVALVVIAAGLLWWSRTAGDRQILAILGGRDADPATDARLCNLVEGLAIGAGVRQPRLIVVDSPGVNAMVAGSRPDRALLAVTTGLLQTLKRIEMEAVLAEQLYLIRHHETVPATVLVATFGLGSDLALPSDRDTAADLGAVSLTRYPPALAAALESAASAGSVVEGQTARTAHLWLLDPREGAPPARGRLPVADRIEALREL